MITQASLCEVQGVFGLFCDALVTDAGQNLVFASLWGRDTAIQELLARLTVSTAEGGLDSFAITVENRRMVVFPRDVEKLNKLTGRMPKGNLFGELVHLWLYDPITLEPDRVNRRAILLMLANDEPDPEMEEHRLWSLVRDVCHLPLLDDWQHILMAEFQQRDWVSPLHHCHGIRAMNIDLGGEELEPMVAAMIQQGLLVAA